MTPQQEAWVRYYAKPESKEKKRLANKAYRADPKNKIKNREYQREYMRRKRKKELEARYVEAMRARYVK